MKLICKTWTTWSSIKLPLTLVGECKCICIPSPFLPPCLHLDWQRLGLGDWRQNQIKATHQPITNRTENVSLVMGCVSRWKVSLRVCIPNPGFGKGSKLPVVGKQTQLYKMKYANVCPNLHECPGWKMITSLLCSVPIAFTLLLFSLSLHSSPDIITMGKLSDATFFEPA